jgi:hypothetical protein
VVLGLVSSAVVLTDALTLVPSPTDNDTMDLKTSTKFTAVENYKMKTYCSQQPKDNFFQYFHFLSSLGFSKIAQLLV